MLEDLKSFADPAQSSSAFGWAKPQIEGIGPSARGGHTCTLIPPSDPEQSAQIVVFGGHYSLGAGKGFEYLNDVHILDVDANTWLAPTIKGTPPSARYAHTACLVGSR